MHLEQKTAETINLTLNHDKAERLLAGLEDHADALGDEGLALRDALVKAGIQARHNAGPDRLEWP